MLTPLTKFFFCFFVSFYCPQLIYCPLAVPLFRYPWAHANPLVRPRLPLLRLGGNGKRPINLPKPENDDLDLEYKRSPGALNKNFINPY